MALYKETSLLFFTLLLQGPRCNFEEWQGVPYSCAIFGGFAIGARVSLLCYYDNITPNAKCQRVPVLALCLV